MDKKLVKIGGVGAFITALYCFSPLLVWAFALIGLSGIVAYLDFALLPLLVIFIVIFVFGMTKKGKTS